MISSRSAEFSSVRRRLKAAALCWLPSTLLSLLLTSPLALGQRAGHSRSRRALPVTRFYETPSTLPAGQAGHLIRSEPTDDYDLPHGLSATRILYHSRSGDGRDVPASAVILVPDRKPPGDGFPVLAWAHPFTGAARRCAPSLQRNLVNGPFLTMYGKLGYAVVAPDYAGLAANGRNAVMDIESNANDVIYAVAAARTAVPQLGRRWLVLGESMGAAAALAVAEQESKFHDSEFLGSVAIGDIAELQPSFPKQSARTAALFAYAVKTIYPDAQVRDILTDAGLAIYQRIEESCDNADLEPQPAASALRPNWESHTSVKQFLERNQLGAVKAGGPLFVLGYEGSAHSATSAHTVDQLCERGDRVEYRQYAVSPGTLLGSTVRDQMAWIQDRFAGRPAPSTCQ